MKLRGLKDENSREIFASFKLFFHLPSSAFLSVQQNQTISQFVNIFLLKDIRRKKKTKRQRKTFLSFLHSRRAARYHLAENRLSRFSTDDETIIVRLDLVLFLMSIIYAFLKEHHLNFYVEKL